MARTFRKFSVIFLTSLGGLLCIASSAFAHNTLQSSSPTDASTLATSPTQWILTFDKSVPLSSASGEVVKNDGVRTALPAPQHGATDNVIVFDLPQPLTGANTARWRLVGTDGHVISGRVSFSIGVSASPSVTSPATVLALSTRGNESPLLPVSRVLLRAISYLSILLLIGMLFSNTFISPGFLLSDVNMRVASLSAYSLVASSGLQLALFIYEARAPGAQFFAGAIDTLTTTPGSMSAMKVVTAGLLAVMMSGRTKTPTPVQLVNFSVLLFLITFAYGGHARSESAPWLGIPINMIHTAAISVWLGGLFIVVFLLVPKLEIPVALMVFQKFGRVAERAVAVLVFTGVIQLLRMYPNPFNVFTSAHGLLLLTKIFIVVGMIYLAAQNRSSLISVIEDNPRQQRMSRRHIMQYSLIEIGLGTAVLLLTAIVVNISPT